MMSSDDGKGSFVQMGGKQWDKLEKIEKPEGLTFGTTYAKDSIDRE